MKKASILAAAGLLALLVSCETLLPGTSAKPQGEVKKSPQLTEGQLQEKFIARRNEGKRLLDAKKWGDALDAYLEANEIRGNAAEILLGIGQAYMGLEYWDKAKIFFDRYIVIEKDKDATVYRMIATFYDGKLDSPESAVKLMGKAIDASVENPLASDFWYRGQLYQQLGKKEEAIADYRVAVDLAKKAKDDKLVTQATTAMAALAGAK
jgi:tetratricopeptide (TPR) repeat protein